MNRLSAGSRTKLRNWWNAVDIPICSNICGAWLGRDTQKLLQMNPISDNVMRKAGISGPLGIIQSPLMKLNQNTEVQDSALYKESR